jgi:hypothetical protein
LHKVEPVDTGNPRENCITLMQRERDAHRLYANVAVHIDALKVCPYSTPMDVEECWELIAEMLPAHGYHTVDIPKGEIGETSKIIEEALELQDAHKQNAKIMAQIEMSDIYGALDQYRKKHYPEISMKDIKKMYTITKRAFDNDCR